MVLPRTERCAGACEVKQNKGLECYIQAPYYWGMFLLSYNLSYFFLLNRGNAKPNKPVPKSNIVDGSGIGSNLMSST